VLLGETERETLTLKLRRGCWAESSKMKCWARKFVDAGAGTADVSEASRFVFGRALFDSMRGENVAYVCAKIVWTKMKLIARTGILAICELRHREMLPSELSGACGACFIARTLATRPRPSCCTIRHGGLVVTGNHHQLILQLRDVLV